MRIWTVTVISVAFYCCGSMSWADGLDARSFIEQAIGKNKSQPSVSGAAASTETTSATQQKVTAQSGATVQSVPPTAQTPSPAGSASLSPAAGFPEPLGAKGGNLTPQRRQALAAYRMGMEAAMVQRDYGAALKHFKAALSAETSSVTLYAMAQCRRAMNRSLEALFSYANVLFEDNRMPSTDRLPAPFAAAAKQHFEQLFSQFVAVKVSLPAGVQVSQMLVRGFPVVSSDLFGQKKPAILIAGVRSRWIPTTQAKFGRSFVFYTRPGKYDIALDLADGRKMVVEKRLLAPGNNQIDFTKERLPSKLVVENVQPGTHLTLADGNAPVVEQSFIDREKAFTLEGLKPGEYTLQASRDGFEDFDGMLAIANGEEARVYLDLAPKPPTGLPKPWKIGLGVGGGVLAVAIVVTAVVLAGRNDTSAKDGTGVMTFSLVK